MDELEPIRRKIYEIRGQRVMLDRDLAAMYGVETKALNQSVKRNSKRFEGDDFMFRLTRDEEREIRLRSQIVTSNISDNQELMCLRSQNVTSNGRGGARYLPYAFTELGVAMLSSVLNSETAIDINRRIMRAFVEFRHLAISLPPSNPAADVAQLRKDFEELKLDIEDILRDQNDINESTRAQLEAINDALTELQNLDNKKLPLPEIGYAAIQKRIDEEKKKK